MNHGTNSLSRLIGRTACAMVLASANVLAGGKAQWVSDEERARCTPKVFGFEFQEGTDDAVKFYLNPALTESISFNYDETKSGEGSYVLEDPLTFADGRKVMTAEDWKDRRREILAIFEQEVYGKLPPKPEAMVWKVTKTWTSDDGFATLRIVRQSFRKDGSGPHVDWLVVTPRHAKGRVPVFLHLNYAGLEKIAAKKTNHFDLPWDMLVANGYAFMSAQYEQITSDVRGFEHNLELFNGVCELWGQRDRKATDNPGTLIVWAWGFMRGLDLAEALPEIDAKRNVVIGSSRLGKAALLAGAFDDRFQVVIPNQTGATGVQLMKRNYGETAKGQYYLFPHWYCGGYWKWADNPRSQPFDQHLLLACVAPRNLLIESYDQKWFDPYGVYLSVRAAAPVWKSLCGRTFSSKDMPCAYDESFLNPPLGFVTRTESHGLSPYDWRWALEFANAVFHGHASGLH